MALSQNFVQQMYVAYFGRPADPQGLAYFAQLNEDALIKTFAASAESQALFNGASGTGAISAIYQNLFNRDAEPAGLLYWAGLINSGQITAVAAALSILRGATNDDLTAVTNKVTVANLFTSHVDTVSKITGYSGDAAAALARKYLKAVDSSANSVNTAQNTVDQAVATAAAAVTPAKGLALTTNSDALVGGSGNDAFTASNPGEFGGGDRIDGGDGNDSLTVTGETGGINSGGITIANVETASFTAGGSINLDTTGWTGLSSLSATGTGVYVLRASSGTSITATASAVAGNQVVVDGGSDVTVNVTGLSGGSVTVGSNTGPTGAIVVNASGSSAGNVFIKGGTSVTLNASGLNPPITVMGTSATTSVALNAGSASSKADLNIIDVNANGSVAGTITSVAASNFSSLNINDNALTTLSLTNGPGNISIANHGMATPTNRTLNVTVNGLTGFSSQLHDEGIYTTLNVTTTGAASSIGLGTAAVTALNISGTAALSMGSLSALTALQTLTVSGSVGLTAQMNTNTALTSIDASGTSGNNTLSLDASKASFTGGSGVDIVSLTSTTVSNNISLGDGNDVVILAQGTTAVTGGIHGGNGVENLVMWADDAATASGSSAFASKVTSFEVLALQGVAGQTIDVGALGAAFTVVAAFGGNGLTLNNFASGNVLALNAPGTSYNVQNSAFAAGLNDTLKITVNNPGTTTNFASTGVTATDVENISIISNSPILGGGNNQLTLLGNSYQTFSVTGANNLVLTATSTAVTGVDASGMTGTGGLTWTAGTLANAAVVKGSAAGADSINMAADANAVTFTGGTGNVTITTGSGNDTITVGGGANVVNVGSGTDRVNITAVSAASASTFTSITGMSAGDSVNIGGSANAMGSQTTDLNTTLLADLNAAAAGAGSSGTPMLHWFNFSGDTYIVEDLSAGSSFVAGTDLVVKLVGTLNLGTVTVAGGVVTL